MTAQKPRAFEMSIELDAPVETVWKVLTDAEELTKWFPTNAAVDPRPGGAFTISWDGDWEWSTTITDWEPLERLRMVDRQSRPFDAEGRPIADAAPVELVLDFTLEARGSRTRLRLVQSGFGHGANWDDEIDGITWGWNTELRVLRHYLDRHRGRARQVAWARATSDLPFDRVWPLLTSSAGVIGSGDVAWLHGGDRCAFSLTTGDPVEGRVVFAHPGRQLLVSAENLGDALFRLSLDRAAGRSMVQVWLSTWAGSRADAQGFQTRAQAAIDRMLAIGSQMTET
jgi:uncharacterized protein YndB with AHSA1/START domain